MMKFEEKVGVTHEGEFVFVDSAGTAVTGQANGTFTKTVIKDGAVAGAITLTVTEISGGKYKYSFDDTGAGRYTIHITHAQNPAGWAGTTPVVARVTTDLAFPNTSGRGIDVDASGGVEVGSFQTGAITAAAFAAGAVNAAALAADAANEIADALLDRAAAIDGYTPKQVLALVAAAVVAKCSGEPNNPVTFRSLNDGADRIASTIDANGNRTTVVLTPP